MGTHPLCIGRRNSAEIRHWVIIPKLFPTSEVLFSVEGETAVFEADQETLKIIPSTTNGVFKTWIVVPAHSPLYYTKSKKTRPAS